MIPNVYSAGNGILLRVLRTDRFKAGILSVHTVLRPKPGETMMTSLLLSVLRRGTEKYPTLADVNRRLDYLYGTGFSMRNYYSGDRHVIGFSADVLDDRYLPDGGESIPEGVLDLICQMLFHPLLDENGLLLEKYVESEKKLQCDSIRSLKNNPRAYAVAHAKEILFADEPCGISRLGTEEEVMAVTAESLTAHWKKLLAGFSPEFFYVGPADPSGLCDLIRSTMGEELSRVDGRRAEIPPSGVVIRSASEVRRAEETLPICQGHLVVGLRTGVTVRDPDFYAALVCDEMLGGSPVSKLFVNVREKKSLCYECSSTFNIYKGTDLIVCGLCNENREIAEAEIFAQLSALTDGDFTDAELEAAKKSLLNAYRQTEDSPEAMAAFCFNRTLAGVNDTVEHCRDAVAAVTREDVIRAAGKWTADTVYFLRGTLDGEEGDDDDED